ncbi:MAG: SatD family protein [candidate division KSB1 bacterium]|nr:SatD family protein [candidate division KSB1 bacterium]MDZ7294722.1 SatD family protein [candidate division KSB1 bacterium]MDZ7337471.1 SatD family protein [candidate division KSB1 bacterium]MDZ7379299.1 SatD family protein [candidate division KSB1 bacterium]MDZ7385844.1 SatD family protein [candidate division KSB1 bacterium]
MEHCVIIGDVQRSRQLENWPEVFQALNGALEGVNTRFASDLLLPFRPTVGDEFQGALQDATNAYAVCLYLRVTTPASLYCGVGVGEVERLAHEEGGMRGTAFYRAREALNACKRQQRTILLRADESRTQGVEVVNALLGLIQALEERWTIRQREMARFYRMHPELTYEEVGRHFGVSKQAVSQVLRGAKWDALLEGERTVNALLARLTVRQAPGLDI